MNVPFLNVINEISKRTRCASLNVRVVFKGPGTMRAKALGKIKSWARDIGCKYIACKLDLEHPTLRANLQRWVLLRKHGKKCLATGFCGRSIGDISFYVRLQEVLRNISVRSLTATSVIRLFIPLCGRDILLKRVHQAISCTLTLIPHPSLLK